MGDLTALRLNDHYRSDEGDVVRDFYIPVLSVARTYDRAVGYFTSTSLGLFSRGLDKLVASGGRIRLVASPHLSPEDVEDMGRGYTARQIAERAALRALEEEMPDLLRESLGYLGRLIADGVLDVKLAFLQRKRSLALYHEKIGVFRDSIGNAIALTGSANETVGGLLGNFESIEVYKSWDDRDRARVLRIAGNFDRLWANETSSLTVLDCPEVLDRVIEMARTARDPRPLDDADVNEMGSVTISEPSGQRLQLPSGFEVRDYQREAVRSWFRNNGRGVFKMATGTGKTKTALVAAAKLSEFLSRDGLSLVTVVVAPYQHLVDQWVDEINLFGLRALPLYGTAASWSGGASAMIDAVNLASADSAAFVTTTATFALSPFQDLIARTKAPVLLIGDEVHNLGSARIRSQLPEQVRYRLGLSATPERWLDEEGTEALFSYFGRPVFEFGMGEAIAAGALCRYTYLPRLVELDSQESVLYGQLTDAIAAMLAAGEDAEDDDGPLGQLLRKRSQVLGHAAGKLPVLKLDLQARRNQWFQLLYCAEGHRPTEDGYEIGPSQLQQALHLTGSELGLSTHSYVSQTPRQERRQLLKRFGSGDDLRVLVSMRCLDEGVDIPDARVAYLLASSSNPRQFIQRRGRILRPAPGKATAEIVDYLAVPSELDEGRFEVERRLVERELTRATEFAELAENYGDALVALRDVKMRYGLIDL